MKQKCWDFDNKISFIFSYIRCGSKRSYKSSGMKIKWAWFKEANEHGQRESYLWKHVSWMGRRKTSSFYGYPCRRAEQIWHGTLQSAKTNNSSRQRTAIACRNPLGPDTSRISSFCDNVSRNLVLALIAIWHLSPSGVTATDTELRCAKRQIDDGFIKLNSKWRLLHLNNSDHTFTQYGRKELLKWTWN